MQNAMRGETEKAFFSRRFTWAGFLIGFSMGGFFDGILLHQILQWHHLLSLVDSPLVQDIRVQILADGLFHALMYLLAMMGLYLLWRTREQFALANAGRWQLAATLLGFGVWNIIDAALFHWILQIHRIRIESSAPLMWDLIWFAVFGLAFTFAGWKLRQQVSSSGPSSRDDDTGSDRSTGEATKVMAISIAVTTAGLIAASPPPGADNSSMVLFKSGTTPSQVFQALDAVDGRILWADRSGTVWAVRLSEPDRAKELYWKNALFVSRSWIGAGCLSWLRV